MKKLILIFALCAVLSMPVMAHAEVAVQTQMTQETKAQLISLIKQLIAILQEQLNTMIAQQNTLNQIVQNTTPVPAPTPTPVAMPAPIIKSMPEIPAELPTFNPAKELHTYGPDLVVIIKEAFDKCVLSVADKDGKIYRENSDVWFNDALGHKRQVITVPVGGKYAYSLVCDKAGFMTGTYSGEFPANEQ